ncbi:SprT family zinc-dependent metalloprotease [Celerinatantimonas sp. YJH-8]|uniref:SprT family zinc-dependent metalloprotease n=1 Tax=Celerinatantimonas sp. YJH-8 TaxID=3228714 RepID=UPI0038CA6FCA
MQELLAACLNYLKQAEQYLKCDLTIPDIRLDLRGKAAGQAHLQRSQLRFNPVLYHENHEHFLIHTTAHEIAHWAVYQHYGHVRPHGKEWQDLMANGFHLPASRLHHYDIATVSGPTFCYHCRCRTYQLSIRRHRAIQRGRQYQCRDCHQLLTPLHSS